MRSTRRSSRRSAAALHRAIGEAIERLSGADLDSRAPELAHHFLKAAPAGGMRRRHSLLDSRGTSGGRSACLRRRFPALPDGDRAPRAERSCKPSPRRCELLLALGEAELRAGERDASRATLEQVAELARSRYRTADLLARAALGLSPGLFAIEAGVIDPLLISLLEEALAGLGTTDSSLRASVLARLAIALVWSDAEERRDALSHEALAVARRVGDPVTLGLAPRSRGTGLSGRRNASPSGSPSSSSSAAALRNRKATDLLSSIAFSRSLSISSWVMSTPPIERSIASGRSARHRRDPHAMWYVELFACVRASIEGRNRDAEEHSRAFLEQGLRVGDVNATGALRRAARRAKLGRGTARGRDRETPRNDPVLSDLCFAWKGALAISYLETGRPDDARRAFEQLASHDFSNMPWNETGTITFCFLAELAAAFDDEKRRRAPIRNRYCPQPLISPCSPLPPPSAAR